MELRYIGGVLPRSVADIILRESETRPFVIEITGFPQGIDEMFADRTYTHTGEDCMGIERTEERPGLNYVWVAKHFGTEDKSGFLMVPDRDSYARIILERPEIIKHAEPFTTTFTPRRAPTVPQHRRQPSDPNRWTMVDTFVFLCGMACGAILLSVFS